MSSREPTSDNKPAEHSPAAEIIRLLSARGKTIAGAESCTAGLVADFIARVPGASKVFWGSFVTYTADAKNIMLNIPHGFLKMHGEVSRPVALAMAEGALVKSGAYLAFSVTGFAGPDGAAPDAPTGTVWVGIANRDEKAADRFYSEAKKFHFRGSRNEVREKAAIAVLEEVLKKLY